MKADKKKLLVIGATGFVGRRFCQQLIDQKYQDRFDITFTARNEQKFHSLFPDFQNQSIRFETLDNYDKKEVEKVIAGKFVVCNFAGPFAKFAPNVVEACANHGVHYLDITGEINFAKEMILKHQEKAIETGACIVPFAGFDSVPSDLAVYISLKKINEKNELLQSVHTIYKAKGGINGGTIASALNISSSLTKEDLFNLHYLCPKERPFFPPLLESPRKNSSGQHVAPFFMEPINNKVVYRTKSLSNHTGYAKNFIYLESMYVSKKFSFITSNMAKASLLATNYLMSTPKLTPLIKPLLPAPGQGPSEDQIKNGFFQTEVNATSDKGTKISFYIEGVGDPGNQMTVNLVLLCLESLSKKSSHTAGFQTPVTAFGDDLIEFANLFNLKIKD